MKKTLGLFVVVILTIFSIGISVVFANDLKVSFVYTDTGVTAYINEIAVASTESGWLGETSGNGFSLDGTTTTIDEAGEFTFSGTCSNGNIYVPKGEGTDNRKIEIVMKGLTLTEPDEGQCPIEIKGGTNRAEISAKNGTINTLTDGNHNETSPKSCINASKKLVLKGKGTLIVNGNNKNGIKSDTKLEVKNLKLKINSIGDALKGDEEVSIESGDIVINTSDDAIKSDEHLIVGDASSESSAEPRIDIQSSYEGLESKVVDIVSGDIKILSNDDTINAVNPTETLDGRYDPECQINISGGSLYAIGGNDGIDSNGDISLTGGKLEIYTSTLLTGGDGAFDTENKLYINGAKVFAADYCSQLKHFSKPTGGSQKYFIVSKLLNEATEVSVTDNGNVYLYNIPVKSKHYFYSSPTLTFQDVNNQNVEYVPPQDSSSEGQNDNPAPAPDPEIKVTKPAIKKLTAGKKSFTIIWKKQTVSGYQLQYSTSKTFRKSVRKTITISKKKTSYTIKKLKARKKYYVRMRAYKIAGGKKKCGKWSDVKKLKTK